MIGKMDGMTLVRQMSVGWKDPLFSEKLRKSCFEVFLLYNTIFYLAPSYFHILISNFYNHIYYDTDIYNCTSKSNLRVSFLNVMDL